MAEEEEKEETTEETPEETQEATVADEAPADETPDEAPAAEEGEGVPSLDERIAAMELTIDGILETLASWDVPEDVATEEGEEEAEADVDEEFGDYVELDDIEKLLGE